MLLASLVPLVILVQTARGEARVPVRLDSAWGPVLPAPLLLPALGARAEVGDSWAEVTVGAKTFRFYLGAPLVGIDGGIHPLAGSASLRGDTLELPIQFVSELLPRVLGSRFSYDARLARLADGATPVLAERTAIREPARLPNGLRKGRVVTVDAGHGGRDPGNPGLYFPGGLKEKDITLDLALLLRDELKRRGVRVVMTRQKDTLIDLRHRGAYCTDECDLFVSLHVNSLPRRPGFTRVRGFETYYLAEAKTEDAARVARMENEAIRFDGGEEPASAAFGLEFILKDLQLNEHLRESARAAELVQSYLQESHTGPDLGVKQAGFMVLTTARRPAILLEAGFSTNREDAKLLSGRSSQRNLAASIAEAIVAYLLEYERKIGQGPVAPSGNSSSRQ